MYAIMRRIKIQRQFMEEAIQKTARFFVLPLRKEPGFLEFYSVQVGEGEFVSISLFETKEEAEEGNRKALEWAREQLFPLAETPAEMVGAGAILLHQKKEAEEERADLSEGNLHTVQFSLSHACLEGETATSSCVTTRKP